MDKHYWKVRNLEMYAYELENWINYDLSGETKLREAAERSMRSLNKLIKLLKADVENEGNNNDK